MNAAVEMDDTTITPTEIQGQSKRTNRLKRRLDKDTSLESLLEGWTQCCFLVPRKQKLCNVARSMHSLFCGNHQPAESVVRDDQGDVEADSPVILSTSNSRNSKKSKERVPCPIDPSHTIFKHSLSYHVKVCTKLRQDTAMSSQVFFRQDCNSYSVTCQPCAKSYVTSEQSLLDLAVDPDVLAAKINACYARIQSQCTEAEDIAMFQESDILVTAPTEPALQPTSSLVYSAEDNALAAKIASKLGQDLTSFRKMRHVDQDILLVHQMRDRGLIATAREKVQTGVQQVSSSVFVELGAGRGLLSYAVSCADPQATVVLVERSGSKKKIDKALKEDFSQLKEAAAGLAAAVDSAVGDGDGDVDGDAADVNPMVMTGAIKRVRMDIRHCYLPDLPGVRGAQSSDTEKDTTPTIISTNTNTSTSTTVQPVVVIAKHLCGVATDLAIQSVRAFPHIPVESGTLRSGTVPEHRVGIAIATCCHHACHFPDYTGRDWYLAQGFTECEFEVLKKWSGWSTNVVSSKDRATATAEVSAASTASVVGTPTDGPPTDSTPTDTTAGDHGVPLNPQVVRPVNITAEQMQLLGWRVKRVLDQGRVEYINRQYTMQAKQVRYCERKLSPECALLVATQR